MIIIIPLECDSLKGEEERPGTELISHGATPKVSSPQTCFTNRVRDGIGVVPDRHRHQEAYDSCRESLESCIELIKVSC